MVVVVEVAVVVVVTGAAGSGAVVVVPVDTGSSSPRPTKKATNATAPNTAATATTIDHVEVPRPSDRGTSNHNDVDLMGRHSNPEWPGQVLRSYRNGEVGVARWAPGSSWVGRWL